MSGALIKPLEAVRAALSAEGGLVAEALLAEAPAADSDHLGVLLATAPRAAADPAEYAFVVEAIREGYLLHYGMPRLVSTDDEDLALLAGDRLYALGLARLASLGDLAAITALADVIADGARAQAAADEDLAEAVWDAGVARVGWGDDDDLRSARAASRAGAPDGARQLRSAARQLVGEMAQLR